MRKHLLSGVVAALLLAGGASAFSAPVEVSANIAKAIDDPARTQADRDLDAARKPAELLSFIGVKPGQTVVDVFPGPYYDRLFADAVGPTGKVYMFIPTEITKEIKTPLPANGSHPMADHPNVTAFIAPTNSFTIPGQADVVWIRQNYHDLYDPFMAPADVPTFNKAVFKALKPGGLFVIVDHSAPDGTGIASTNTTHRIDAAVVKKDMTAAGFKFVRESDLLRNPADPRTKLVFDASIRGKTDQFVYVFKKP